MTFLSKIPLQAVTLLSMITSIFGYKQGSTYIHVHYKVSHIHLQGYTFPHFSVLCNDCSVMDNVQSLDLTVKLNPVHTHVVKQT